VCKALLFINLIIQDVFHVLVKKRGMEVLAVAVKVDCQRVND
jgi:hypothetical protein